MRPPSRILAAGIGLLGALMLLASASPVRAAPDDRALAALAVGILALDCAQTHAIQRDGLQEANTLLGPHPRRHEINAYFAGCALAVIGVSAALEREDRRTFLWIVIAVEAAVVLRNASLGVGIRF